MDRDTFIITVYCLVTHYWPILQQQYPGRRGGFAPRLTDQEVITMEICGEFFKLHSDKDLYEYFSTHYRHFFPNLPERTLFVRQAANLWHFKAAFQQLLVRSSGQDQDGIQAIDTMPLPVCTYTRAPRDRRFKTLADYGHCAAKKLDYYGFKLGLRISRAGMITHYCLLSARAHDVTHLGALIEGFRGLVPADKGFLDAYQKALWAERQQVEILAPARSNMKAESRAPVLLQLSGQWRKLIETVNSQLSERLAIAKSRVGDFWHYQHRLIRKVLTHTVAVFLNLQMGRRSLDFAGLLCS